MATYVCPICHSNNIVPLFAKSNRWICLDCGYEGVPQLIAEHLKPFWEEYLQIEKRTPVSRK
ncbi:MAG: hypothetical protein ACP5G1_02075 [Nanopusillaceae archaeon]